jgi:hypothetical protein
MYAHLAAYGIRNSLGNLPEVFAAVSAGCIIQIAPDIGRNEIPLHIDIDFIAFLYAKRSRIVDLQSVFVFASHINTSFSC